MPYDWRKPHQSNGVHKMLKPLLKKMHELTGKRSMIISHSMGNLGVLSALYDMDLKFKDQYVLRWVQMGAPFLGAAKALKF